MKKLLLMILAFLSLTEVSAQKQPVISRYSVRCLGVELDGSQTLRVLGYGKKRGDAKEQAMKNAVWAVIFDGVRDGVEGCNTRPLVTEANARERYEDYFNAFFQDGGEYTKYVNLSDTRRRSSDKNRDKIGYSIDRTVRVLRSELKARLKQDNIIK